MGTCIDDDLSPCDGDVHLEPSSTGHTYSHRCRRHRAAYLDRMAELHRDISSRYPGFDIPGSPPPPDFDPLYAGERWDDD